MPQMNAYEDSNGDNSAIGTGNIMLLEPSNINIDESDFGVNMRIKPTATQNSRTSTTNSNAKAPPPPPLTNHLKQNQNQQQISGPSPATVKHKMNKTQMLQ